MKKKAYQSVFMVLLSSGCGQSIYMYVCLHHGRRRGREREREREGEREGGRERGGGERKREKERENGGISNTTQVIVYSTLT